MISIGKIWRTVRHLTARQLIFQVLNRLRRRGKLLIPKTIPATHFLAVPEANKPMSWQGDTFTFLNQTVQFTTEIDWNHSALGKLWTYNLNYFDFLNQPSLHPDEGQRLILDFIRHTPSLRDGLEPYPTSLRITNWVQFLSHNRIQNDHVNTHLFAQANLLSYRLEFHLAGNHLLENGFSLLTAALYFRHKRWFQKAARLVRNQLTTQILADGGHSERSPMYHQILLDRLLDVLLALQHDSWHHEPTLRTFLAQKAVQMLYWLDNITFRNGDVPMLNDASFGIAPTTAQLREKAKRAIGLMNNECKPKSSPVCLAAYSREQNPVILSKKTPFNPSILNLSDSGYRIFRQPRYELVADVGPVGPDHQPGHAHADTLSFVLTVDNLPIIVDNGTSTYQPGERRNWERSTVSHNTVTINNENSSEVWANFRVGRRARVSVLTDTETVLIARHDGYKKHGIIHERLWAIEPGQIRIIDQLLNSRNHLDTGRQGVARFYFHSAVPVNILNDVLMAGPLQITFKSVTKLNMTVKGYELASGFNQLVPSLFVEIPFINRLETTLTLLHENIVPNVLF